ncbi:MAG: methionine adenosyltransferase [Candidatus Taylorbacteria bacterium]
MENTEQNGMPMGMRKARSMAVEFVTNGHPDKVCDQMADSILDAAISQDPLSRVAMEVTGGHGIVFVTGEMTTKADFDIGKVVRDAYLKIGHDHSIGVITNVVKQSPHISQGVDTGGAGDQGIMVGYAVKGELDFMPKPWGLARKLTRRLREVRVKGILPYLRPDGKSQVTMTGDRVTHVTIAAHHSESVSLEQVRHDIISQVVQQIIPQIDAVVVVVNGTGIFAQGGFEADAGTTGRKLIVDNYGPVVEIGGGAYSGKDPSKVDRSAAYFCRMVAKSIVAGGHADEAIVKVGYAIGVAKPTFFSVETSLPEKEALALEERVRSQFCFEPRAIIDQLGLLKPKGWCYCDTAEAGHYGDDRFPWEQVSQIV